MSPGIKGWKWECLLTLGDTAVIPLNWKLRQLPGCFGLFMHLNEQSRKSVTTLVGVTDSNYQGDIGLQWRQDGSKEKYVWNIGNSLGHLFVLSCYVIKINRKL